MPIIIAIKVNLLKILGDVKYPLSKDNKTVIPSLGISLLVVSPFIVLLSTLKETNLLALPPFSPLKSFTSSLLKAFGIFIEKLTLSIVVSHSGPTIL